MSPLKIVLVEKNSDIRRFLARHLAEGGHDIREAGSKSEGVAVLSKEIPDVLISDSQFPDGTAADLLREAALPVRIYTIALTIFREDVSKRATRTAGYRRVIVKPEIMEQLDGWISEAVLENR